MMNAGRSGWRKVSLDVGGLGIDLVCSRADLAQQLASRYKEYPPVSQNRFVALVDAQHGASRTSLLDQPVKFQRGVLAYDSAGCQGFVDPENMRGSLSLVSEHTLEETDYYLRIICALIAFESGGLLFHSAGVVYRHRALLFFGHSGSGKSTIAALSPADAVMNDDLLMIMPAENGWLVYATPFWNTVRNQPPLPAARLAGIFRLVQDKTAFLAPLDAACGVAEMVANSPVVSADKERSAALLERCESILNGTPAYYLHFLPDASFWQVIEQNQ